MTTERKLNGIWNAERILKEYLSLADKRGKIRDIDLSDDSPHGIEVRRFVAAMKAYGKDMNNFNVFEGIVSSACSQEKMCLWPCLNTGRGYMKLSTLGLGCWNVACL